LTKKFIVNVKEFDNVLIAVLGDDQIMLDKAMFLTKVLSIPISYVSPMKK